MRTSRDRALLIFGAAWSALLLPLLGLERRMQRTGGPGIVPFELAGTPDRARFIMERWGADGQAAARRSLLLDYPFLLAYTGFNLAACAAAEDALRRRGMTVLAAAGKPIAVTQIAAGTCDAIEDTALLGVLAGRHERLPAVARVFALAKFTTLTVGWVYAALGLAAHVTRRP
jgi:hypothetical protein